LNHFKAQLQDEVIPVSAQVEAAREWCQKLNADLSAARMTVKSLLIDFQVLAEQANAAVTGMDFRFLA
jgi:hypothetical protein